MNKQDGIFERRNELKSVFWILAGVLIVITLLFPGDAPWINDEPILIYTAFTYNQQGIFPGHGIYGSIGIPYGPLPIWFYKCLLFFSKDLIFIVFLKALLTLSVVFLSLYFIAKKLNLSTYPLLLPLASPYLYLYSRTLWDICFLIPISILLMLCLVKLIDTHRLSWFSACLFSMVCLIHIHLISMLIVIPFFIFLILFEWKWLLKHLKNLSLLIIVFLCSLIPYAKLVLTKSAVSMESSMTDTWYNWLAPVKIFSFWGFDNYFAPEMLTKDYVLPGDLYILLKYLTGLAFVFFVIGFIIITLNLWTKIRKKMALTTEENFSAFCLITIVFSILFFIASRISFHPQYSNIVCFAYFFIIYSCLKLYWQNKIVRCAFWAYFLSMLFLLISFSFYIHMAGGNRGIHYGATLKNQIAIVNQINSFHSKSPIYAYVDNLKMFPHEFHALQALYGKSDELRQNNPLKKIKVVYKNNDKTGWLTLDISDK